MRTRPSRLGCLSTSAITAAIGVVILVVGVYLFGGAGLFSPGPLSAQARTLPAVGVSSHAEITNCADCHPAPWSGESLSDRCLQCHTDVRDDPKNFHAVMFAKGQPAACNSCHTEHHGATASLTRVMDAQTFQHDLLGYSLRAHSKMAEGNAFQCSDCHKQSYAGAFDQAVCETCHASLDAAFTAGHLQAFGADCLACHDGIDTYGKTFDHTQVAFSLTGKHKAVPCSGCHQGAQDLAALKATQQACSACHAKDDIHQGTLGQDCGQCHNPNGWQGATFDHNLTDFPLAGKHQTVACISCHLNNVYKGTPKDCYACHAKNDAHNGTLGTDCSLCHMPAGWLPSTFNHALTIFPLTGAHASLACSRCHVAGPNGMINFKGTPTSCSGCHADPAYHAGLFGLDCTSCHTTSGWIPAQFNRPHNFDLHHEGASSCQDCHPNNLNTFTCVKCHPGGAPPPEGGGGN